jgi:hypothetical protein
LVDYITLFGVLIAGGGLIFTGSSFWRLGKTEELRLVLEVYRDIANSLKEHRKQTDPEKKEFFLTEFFSDVNTLCYLIRHGQIKDDELIYMFRDQLITWYGFFVESERPNVVNNVTSYPDFKHLYRQMKLEKEKENTFNEKHLNVIKFKILIRLIKVKLKRRRYY